MAPIKIDIQSRSGRTIAALEIDDDATVKDLKKKFASTKRQYYPERQRFSLPLQSGEVRSQPISDDSKRLKDYGLKDGSALVFKDLGPQIGYATVFFWEYFGPLMIYPLFFFLPNLYLGMRPAKHHALAQQLALAYWCFHYLKRLLETFFIHRFGHATMPIKNLFINCGYYWTFAGIVSYFINHPLYTPPPETQTLVALVLALLCQLGNFRCHVILANLRAPGEKAYKIPHGFLFDYITCANYTCEIWGWICFAVAVQALPALVFAVAGAIPMSIWALQKHKRLRKTFDGKEGRPKYPCRWVMFPPFY